MEEMDRYSGELIRARDEDARGMDEDQMHWKHFVY